MLTYDFNKVQGHKDGQFGRFFVGLEAKWNYAVWRFDNISKKAKTLAGS